MDPCTSSWSPQEQYRSDRLAWEIRTLVEDVISYAFSGKQRSFFAFERGLSKRIASLGCLFVALFLQVRHERLDVNSWSKRLGSRAHGKSARRTLRTMFGEVAYWRHYFYGKKRGCHPLDIELGLFADGFSPMVIGLMTRMATRMSFKTSGAIFGAFLRWSPSTRTIEEMVLGLGRKAAPFMEETPSKQVGDDEILVIEADGKATPTATEQELEKRRGKRSKPCENGCLCGCQRHRSRRKRAKRDTPARRKKGDKSKNGKSATIVAVYTLKRGEDGQYHGPYNKRIWASYAPRKVMLEWAKREAERRGIDPQTATNVHVVIDGEKCLAQGLQERFPNASIAIDIRHVEEKLWNLGNLFHKEGSEELNQWVEQKRDLLYAGVIKELIETLQTEGEKIGSRGPGTKNKREKLAKVVHYLSTRVEEMKYGELIEKDLVIASGVIEGAARYVIGERLDCSGMRWITGRAEALLQLRCIELNGDWDRFYRWARNEIETRQRQCSSMFRIRTSEPLQIPNQISNGS